MERLERIRRDLRAQEQAILAALAERARYARHEQIYRPGSPHAPRFADPLPALRASPPHPVEPNRVDLGPEVVRRYAGEIVPLLCEPGACGREAESARCDAVCLEALVRRVHCGVFVAEVKFRADPVAYAELVRAEDEAGILARLRDEATERDIVARVRERAAEVSQGRLGGDAVARIFAEQIIPLTLRVEVEYLRARRLEV